MPEKPDLAALIGSRICHDLISPIGAIGNGVELMLMDSSSKGPELSLISESVANANARIRFFRVAFGAAGGDARIGRPEVLAILSEVTKGGRLQISWTSPADLARREVKIAFLLIQCLETAMPWGGQVVIGLEGTRWSVTGTASRLRIDPSLWEVLSNPHATTEITPALVHFALIPAEIAQQGRRLTVEMRETEIRLGY
jgi:histidine phosphotransferase ChpT